MGTGNDEYGPDAWRQYEALLGRFTRFWWVREDMQVLADGCGRHVKINGEHHNVGTVRAYIAALAAACDFVDASNPTWAQDGDAMPVEVECPDGHRTFGDHDDLCQRLLPSIDLDSRRRLCLGRLTEVHTA